MTRRCWRRRSVALSRQHDVVITTTRAQALDKLRAGETFDDLFWT